MVTPALEANTTSIRVGDSCVVVYLTVAIGATETTVREPELCASVTTPKPSMLYADFDTAGTVVSVDMGTVVSVGWAATTEVVGDAASTPSPCAVIVPSEPGLAAKSVLANGSTSACNAGAFSAVIVAESRTEEFTASATPPAARTPTTEMVVAREVFMSTTVGMAR